MTDSRQQLTLAGLESALADLASAIDFPPTPDLASAVGRRLRERPVRVASRRPIWRSLRRSLLLAAAIALLIAGAAVAVRFALGLLTVELGPVPTPAPSAEASPGEAGPVGSRLGLGVAEDLDIVRAEVGFDLLVPAALGAPEAVYVGGPALRGQVAFVYRPDDALPPSSLLGGAGLLVTQSPGRADERLGHKLVDAGLATLESVVVEGAAGYWISGQPHVFWYLAPDGSFIEDSRRLVGDTLVWERDGVLYRIEGAVTLDKALEIAVSMR